MCNAYEVDGTFFDLAGRFNASPVGALEFHQQMVFPRGMSPGLLMNADGERELHPMQFALAPKNSKTPSHAKYPFNNAAIETLKEEFTDPKYPHWKKNWKQPFEERRCVVPLSRFREPCYWGPHAGHQLFFHAEDTDYLGVAGLYNLWKSPDDSATLVTMTFLLVPASFYIDEHGHHRQPLFINEDGFDDWMKPGTKTLEEGLDILREHYATPTWSHTVLNEMKTWKSRVKAAELKRVQQKKATKDNFSPLLF